MAQTFNYFRYTDNSGANWAVKYRPSFACVGCGKRTFGTFGHVVRGGRVW